MRKIRIRRRRLRGRLLTNLVVLAIGAAMLFAATVTMIKIGRMITGRENANPLPVPVAKPDPKPAAPIEDPNEMIEIWIVSTATGTNGPQLIRVEDWENLRGPGFLDVDPKIRREARSRSLWPWNGTEVKFIGQVQPGVYDVEIEGNRYRTNDVVTKKLIKRSERAFHKFRPR